MPEKFLTVIIPVTLKLFIPSLELFSHFPTGSRTLEHKLSCGVRGRKVFPPSGVWKWGTLFFVEGGQARNHCMIEGGSGPQGSLEVGFKEPRKGGYYRKGTKANCGGVTAVPQAPLEKDSLQQVVNAQMQ